MLTITVVVHPRRISPSTRVGSTVAQLLQPPQPHGALKNREIGCVRSPSRTGLAAAAGSYTIATPRGSRRALGQRWIRPPATAAALKP
jgi:hypothetical protein